MGRKKVYDSIHRFIHVDELETKVIESLPFQRLNYVHQLGMAFLVYPGGTHKRFEHSLGVMEVATKIYDQVTILDPKREDQLVLDKVPKVGTKEHIYWRSVVRMAAICHDMGHLPLSHSAESKILGEGGHESWTRRIILSDMLKPFWDELNELMPEQNTAIDIAKAAIGPNKMPSIDTSLCDYSPWEKIVSEIITGDFFGADRIDYLLRDAQYTGLSYGMFDYHQLLETLRIVPSAQVAGELEIGVEENGIEACEALLLSRYFLHKRLSQYPAVKSYTFHLARFMEVYFKEKLQTDSVEDYISMNDSMVLAKLHEVIKDPDAPGYYDACVLLKQARRYKAIPLKKGIDLTEMMALQSKHQIPDGQIDWEQGGEHGTQLSLDFPVRLRSGDIVSGELLSDITIPRHGYSWIFLSYDHLDTFLPEAMDSMPGDA